MADLDYNRLIEQIAQGDRVAFSEFYTAFERALYGFIRRRLNDPFESADILHDVFIEVWRGAERFEGRSTVKSWVFGIAYRKIMDNHRRTGKLSYTDQLPETVSDEADGEACLLAAQESTHVRACIDSLKEDHRSAIELAFFADMTYKEISAATDVPEGTVKTRIYHAKQLLMHCLSGRMEAKDA
ncbi:RNA polymerase sigma factor [Litoreibacter arenae]|uniref:Putative RNA polymerase sigma factor n=1 Tax=Litoreibacter arenae DSM 19593 TaxID=1123360 RepID=S9QB58_9RHOB|nr:RNA polymerase sigma factor [Litoreibacter arenae]EPX78601.1 putative RNA polymerase sigma factor [Litoreibacter arenae DSM 19593]